MPLNAQSYFMDTLKNALAYSSNFIPLPVYGITSNGHIYTCGLNNNYAPNGEARPLVLLRIDLTTGALTQKVLEGSFSSPSVLWEHVFDSAGNFYLGLNSHNRKVFRFNLKDSIAYENLGNGFKDNRSLAYSFSLGADNHLYFGGSSGGTYWTEYDPLMKSITQHPAADSVNDYVLTIQSDTDYVYCQTGQRNGIYFWSIRKADDQKKLLFKIPNSKRFNTLTGKDGVCYVSFTTDTLTGNYRLKNGSATKVISPAMPLSNKYQEVNGGMGQPNVISNFDASDNKIYYSINDSFFTPVSIPCSKTNTEIRAILGFKNDSNHIYYAGDYYGSYYCYDLKKDTAILLGNTGYNIYASLEQNDSIMWMSGYPSGYIMQWNRNKPWTTQKFINGRITNAYKNANANPKLMHYFKSNTAAGFHHASLLESDGNGNIIAAGNVIRIGNTSSIGTYNILNDSIYGYNFEKISKLGASGLATWGRLMVLATYYSFGGQPKLYFYDPQQNIMRDSLQFGFDDYGKIYIKGNILTGISRNRIYSVNLSEKKIIKNFAFAPNSILGSYQLTDGYITVNTRNNIPKEMTDLIQLPYTIACENNGQLYAISGKNIIRIRLLKK